jgi:hypothetical protein
MSKINELLKFDREQYIIDADKNNQKKSKILKNLNLNQKKKLVNQRIIIFKKAKMKLKKLNKII